MFRTILLTLNLIATVSLAIFFCVKDKKTMNVKMVIGFQICLPLGLFLSMYWTRLLGFFLSFSAFTIPFLALIFTGQMAGEKFDALEQSEKNLIVWEWLLYPVGTALYFFTFLFYWAFRRLRRRYFETKAQRY